MFVAVEGLIASGKSTTARLLGEGLGYSVVLEQTHRHPFVGEFYAEPSAFAFETELAFVLLHYHQLHPLPDSADMVTDFSPVKDLVFAEMNLKGDELATFRATYDHCLSRLRLPDVVVLLDMPEELAKQRALARGRPFEMNLSIAYLSELRSHYFHRLKDLGHRVDVVPVLPNYSTREVADEALAVIKRLSG